jgi:hypothetical protein
VFDIGPRVGIPFERESYNNRASPLQAKAVRDFGILISHESVSWNVKQTNRVTVFDIEPRVGTLFERELHKITQCFRLATARLG